MIEEHRKILENSIKDSFSFREKFSDFEVNSNFQSLISQLDLFKSIASLVIAVIGVGYLFNEKLDKDFLLISLISALVTLILSVSYTREVIDLQPKQNKEIHIKIIKKTDESNDVIIRAFKEDNADIFFDYAKQQVEEIKNNKEPSLNYMGETIVFFFYLSIGCFVLSVISQRFSITILSVHTVVLLLVLYLLSFKNWAFWLSAKLSLSSRKSLKVK